MVSDTDLSSSSVSSNNHQTNKVSGHHSLTDSDGSDSGISSNISGCYMNKHENKGNFEELTLDVN